MRSQLPSLRFPLTRGQHTRTRTRNEWFAIGDDDVDVNFVGPPLPSRLARLGGAGWWLGSLLVVLSLGFTQSWVGADGP